MNSTAVIIGGLLWDRSPRTAGPQPRDVPRLTQLRVIFPLERSHGRLVFEADTRVPARARGSALGNTGSPLLQGPALELRRAVGSCRPAGPRAHRPRRGAR